MELFVSVLKSGCLMSSIISCPAAINCSLSSFGIKTGVSATLNGILVNPLSIADKNFMYFSSEK
ncbi:hypothetical protein D3C72_2387000 [compost metagenome]